MKLRRDRGLTLVEILAVVLILGLMATVLLTRLTGSVDRARNELARSAVHMLASRLELFHLVSQDWPDHATGLRVLTSPLASPADAFYVQPATLIDPWGRPFHYRRPGPHGHPFEIICAGADGVLQADGGSDDITSASTKEAP